MSSSTINLHEGFEPIFTNENILIPETVLLELDEKIKPFLTKLEPAKIFDLKTQTEIIHERRDCLKTVIYDKELFEFANNHLLPIINHVAEQKNHTFEFIESHIDLIKYQKDNHFDVHFDFISNHTNITQQYTLLIGLCDSNEGKTYIWDDELNDFKPFTESIIRGGMLWFCSDIKHFAEKIKEDKTTKLVLSYQLRAVKRDEITNDNTIILKSNEVESVEYYVPKKSIQNTLFEVMIENNGENITFHENNNIITILTNLNNQQLSKIVSYLKNDKEFTSEEMEEIREILNFYMINHVEYLNCKISSKYLHILNEQFSDKDYVLFNSFEPWMVQWAKDMNYIPFQIIVHWNNQNNVLNNFERDIGGIFVEQILNYTNNDNNLIEKLNDYIPKMRNISGVLKNKNLNELQKIYDISDSLQHLDLKFLPFHKIWNQSALNLCNDGQYDYQYENNIEYDEEGNIIEQKDNEENNQGTENKNIEIFYQENTINEHFLLQNFEYKKISIDKINSSVSKNLNHYLDNKKLHQYEYNLFDNHLKNYDLTFESLSFEDKSEYLLMIDSFGNNFNYLHMKSLNFPIEMLYSFSSKNNLPKLRTFRKLYYENIKSLDDFSQIFDDKYFDFEKIMEQFEFSPLNLKFGDVIEKENQFIDILTTINNGELLFGTNNMSYICQVINSFKKKDGSHIPLLDKIKGIIYLYQYLEFSDMGKKIDMYNIFNKFTDINYIKIEHMLYLQDYDNVNNLLKIRFNNFCLFTLFQNPILMDYDHPLLNKVFHNGYDDITFKRESNIKIKDLCFYNTSYFDTSYQLSNEDKKRVFSVFNNINIQDALKFRDNIKEVYSHEESGCNDDGGDRYYEYRKYNLNVFYIYFGFLKQLKNKKNE